MCLVARTVESRATVVAVPALDLAGLTLPDADTAPLRRLLSLHTGLLARDFLALPTPDALSKSSRISLESTLSTDARLAARVLRHPTHAALVDTLRRRPADRLADLDALRTELHLTTLARLAIAGAITTPIHVEKPSAGWPVLRLPELAATCRAEGGGLTFSKEFRPVSVTRAYVPIVGGLQLALTDNNPLVDVQQHPERPGNPLELGDRTLDEWLAALRDAVERIERYLPALASELRSVVTTIVPVGFHAERHFSCSYEGAVGALYLSLHPNPMTMTEALVHEFQHNKLNMAFRLDPLLTNAWSPLYPSPVRPDPRPLHGVAMALHAFVPVAELYRRMSDANDPLTKGRDWDRRFREVRALNAEAASVVFPNARATTPGRTFFDDLQRLQTAQEADSAARWPS